MNENYYNYKKLAEKALAYNASQEDINALGEWFNDYGCKFWNGECFDIDGNHALYPVYKEVDEDDFELVGYEIR